MKIKVVAIIGLLILTCVSTVEASSLILLNKDFVNYNGMDGRIYGWIETQERCMKIGVSDLKVACGKNLKDYETTITDEDGFFEFSELTYKDTGTRYIIWIPPGQKVIFPGFKKVELNDNNLEENVYFFVLLWWPLISDKVIKNQLFSFGSFAGFQSMNGNRKDI